MSIRRTYYCDAPECLGNASTMTPPPYLPSGYVHAREVCDGVQTHLYFCSWDCVLKYGATVPPVVRIPWGDVPLTEDPE